jgi:adenylate cyclase
MNFVPMLYRWISRFQELRSTKPKLSAIMATFFVCLSIPILIFILAYNYYRNSEVMVATLKDDVAKTRQASIENVEGMIQSVASTLRLIAEVVAADPALFRTDRSREILFRTLTSAEEIGR